MLPLAMTGTLTAALTAAIAPQSARPSRLHSRVRPCTPRICCSTNRLIGQHLARRAWHMLQLMAPPLQVVHLASSGLQSLGVGYCCLICLTHTYAH